MNLSLDKIKIYFPDFNVRAHVEDDFWRTAKKTKTSVRETPLLIEGYYEYKNGRHCILINSLLNRQEWLLTAFHEIAHRLLDAAYRKNGIILKRDLERIRQKQERRAEDIALILLIPQTTLFELQNTPFEDLHPFLQKHLVQRQRVYERQRE